MVGTKIQRQLSGNISTGHNCPNALVHATSVLVTFVQLGKEFGLDFVLEGGQILICGEVKSTHSPWVQGLTKAIWGGGVFVPNNLITQHT